VVARPVRYGVVAALVLAVLAAPVVALRIGFSDNGNAVPSSTLRKSYDLLAEGFGPGFNGPMHVVVELDGTSQDRALLTDLGHALDSAEGVERVDPPVVSPKGDLAVFSVTPTTAPQDERTAQLLEQLRDDVLPEAVGDDVETMVTGSTAFEDDISDRVSQRMPWFIGAVLGLSLVVLTIVFRSVLVPVKAALLNLISIGAAYGVLVAVFQ